MSKKRNPLEDPPAASSSDDEEVESSAEEEEDSSSEDEDDNPAKPPSSSTAVTIAVPGKPNNLPAATKASDSESGSETETDSESEPEQPAKNKGSGKVTFTVKLKKKDDTPPPPVALALPAKSGGKRPSEGTSKETTTTKRVKKDEEKKTGEESKKPGAFQRLWSEEDEIAVLQGMIDFKKDTGKSPYDDTNVYYDYIKKSISFEVSKSQFMDKIRSLRKKYIGNEKKQSFTKPHDLKSYRLCQYIWGPDGMGLESAVKSNGGASKKKTKKLDSVKQELSFGASPNGKTVVVDDDEKDVAVVSVAAAKKHDWFENSFLVKAIAGFGVDEHCVKQRWGLVPGESKKKVGEKLKLLQAKEIEYVLQKTEVLREVTAMIAEASKNKQLDI